MSYFIPDQYGRFDLSKQFVADLAKALGGSNVNPEYQGGTFELDNLRVYIRAGYGAKTKRVTLGCGTTDGAAHRIAYARGSVPKFPEITIDPDRDIDSLVKDIRRRLIEPAAEPMAKLQELARAQGEAVDALRQHAERLNKTFPGAVALSHDETSRSANLHISRNGAYISGRLNADGSLYVDRVSAVGPAKVEALLHLLCD